MPVGAELADLDSLKSTFDSQTENVQQLITSIRGRLGATVWTGPASDRFRSSWQSDFEPMLQRLVTALTDAGSEVSRRRVAIDTATS